MHQIVRRIATTAVFCSILLGSASCGGSKSALHIPQSSPGGGNSVGPNTNGVSASPSSLTFTAIGPADSQTFVASTQFAGDIGAVSSDVTVAAVNPASAPAVKDPNDSRKSVTFTVTPIGPGTCTITVTDKKDNTAVVSVTVSQSHDTWTTKAPMSTARGYLAAGVVNGDVYAIGGYNGSYLNTVEAYDPLTDSWSTKAPMPTARAALAAGVVNGILYAVGGSDGTGELNTVEAYDPSTNTWTTKAPMPTARQSLAVGVVNGILYAVGGNNAYLNTVEAYNPLTDTWTTKAPMPTAREGLAIGVINGILYADGGSPQTNTLEAYDPLTDNWTTKAPMPTARYGLAAGVINGNLYAVGGGDTFGNTHFLNTNEVYKP